MVRKSFLLKFGLVCSTLVEIYLIISVFIKPATGPSLGAALVSFILLPVNITFLTKLSALDTPAQKTIRTAAWAVWVLIATLLLVIVYVIVEWISAVMRTGGSR